MARFRVCALLLILDCSAPSAQSQCRVTRLCHATYLFCIIDCTWCIVWRTYGYHIASKQASWPDEERARAATYHELRKWGTRMKRTDRRDASERGGDKSQVQVIARAAAILRALEDQALGLSLGQIAQRVDLARSTVQRIVAALEAEKLLIAASPNGRVRLGPPLLRLAA